MKGKIAKDRFAFDQAMQGHDCQKIRQDGDFVVQKRDFFGNKVGEPTTYEVKTGNSKLTKLKRKGNVDWVEIATKLPGISWHWVLLS